MKNKIFITLMVLCLSACVTLKEEMLLKNSQVLVEYDEFKGITSISSGLMMAEKDYVEYQYRLNFQRSKNPKDKDGIILYGFSESYDEECKFNEAYVKVYGKTKFNTEPVHREVVSLGRGGYEILYTEKFYVLLQEKQLKSDNAFSVKLYGDNCNAVLNGDGVIVESFLKRVDGFKTTGK